MVCATARSGSNLLTDGLHATRRAGRPKQFFLPKFEQAYAAKHGLDAQADFGGYVHGVVAAAATSNEVFGFKLMGWYLGSFLERIRTTVGLPGETDPQMLARVFPRLRYLRIIRANKVRQAISKARAIQSGLWKVQPGNAAAREPVFDAALITRCFEETLADEAIWDRFFEAHAITPHLVRYEDLCTNYDATIRSTLRFIGAKISDSSPIEPVTIRQSDAHSDRWEEMYRAAPTGNAPQPETHV